MAFKCDAGTEIGGYRCCPGASVVGGSGPDDCTANGSRCVCYGFHDIVPTCSNGWTGSPCCGDTDCAWGDTQHTGYCKDNKCIVWEKWPNGHACENASDCMNGYCTYSVCSSSGPDYPDGHECKESWECQSNYCALAKYDGNLSKIRACLKHPEVSQS